MDFQGWTIGEWGAAYRAGRLDAPTALRKLRAGLNAADPAWIHLLSPAELERELEKLAALGSADTLPLYGVPYAVKDNIDAAGLPTTAACPDFRHLAEQDSGVVARLRAAGAVLIGKTNLDQFATGLNGTRSPYGPVPNSFDPRYVSGGSSSGSASVVARGLVAFALGTDTAGSGRVPAAFNNLVGLKPTRGLVSAHGVVPACRSLDCVSVLALTLDDAQAVLDAAAGYDEADPYSRPAQPGRQNLGAAPRLGIPAAPQWFGDTQSASAFDRAKAQLADMGATLVPVDFAPLNELAALLYSGPWVAERHAAIRDFMAAKAASMHPVVRQVIEQAGQYSATDLFQAEYRRTALVRHIADLFGPGKLDALLVPSAPTFPTTEAVLADPIRLNSQLGAYTNFVNLADLSALALPAGFRNDGLPFGITLIAPAWHDAALAGFGRQWQARHPWALGATGRNAPPQPPAPPRQVPGRIPVAVVGAHLTGMPLNHQLTSRDAQLMEATRTAPRYRLFALPGTVPPKPGLMRDEAGASVLVEVWSLDPAAFGAFVAEVPPPLGIGTVELADGRQVKGFICEPWALKDAEEITHHGGWRAFIASRSAA